MKIIDGKEVSQNIYQNLKREIRSLSNPPSLVVIILGERKDTLSYVGMKQKKCKELCMTSQLIKLSELTTQAELLDKIEELNQDESIDGILVQLPLPDHIDKNLVLESINIEKDVDGFHYSNMGKLAIKSNPSFVPCTPLGVIELFKYYNIKLEGKHIVVIGKSNIVGLPLSLLLMHEEATVTVCHIKTQNIKDITRTADILVSACGQPQMIKKDWIKDNIDIIDIGISPIKDDTKKKGYRLVGDVDFEDVKEKVNYITPVPGGVGPMTVAMLMKQTFLSASRKLENNKNKILSDKNKILIDKNKILSDKKEANKLNLFM